MIRAAGLVSFMIIVINSVCFAVPRPNAVHVGREGENGMMRQAVLINVMQIPYYQIRPHAALFIRHAEFVIGGRTFQVGYHLTRSENYANSQPPRTFCRGPSVLYAGPKGCDAILKPIIRWRKMEGIGAKNDISGNGISSVFDEQRIPDAAIIIAVFEFRRAFEVVGNYPRALADVQRVSRVIGGLFSYNQRTNDPDGPDNPENCPYACDPVKAFGGPKLSRPEVLFGGLMFFVGFMYLSDKGLERRPFSAQHVGFWLMAVGAGCLAALAGIPMVLRLIWPSI